MKNFYIKSLLSLSLAFFFSLACFTNSYGNSDFSVDDNICIDGNLTQDEIAAMGFLVCNTAPVLTCPSIDFGCPGTSIHPNSTGYATALPGDPGCVPPTVTYVDIVVTNNNCLHEIHREWTAKYNDPNTNPWLYSDCTQIIYHEDSQPPSIQNCPADITLNLGTNGCSYTATWTPPSATDNCGVSSFTSNYQPGSTFPTGVTAVTYTAVDNCGLSSTCTFYVHVIGSCCNQVPMITCPSNFNGCAGDSTDPAYTGSPTATYPTGGCGSPTVTYVDNVLVNGPCSGNIELSRVWTATNPNYPSLTASCTQIINVTDYLTPTITGCPSDITVQITSGNSSSVSWTDPTANDNCDLASFLPSHANGSVFYLGTTPVTYTATDDCSNVEVCSFNVTVEFVGCNNPPVITCPANVVACIGTDTTTVTTGVATAVAGDPFCDPPIVKYKDHVLIDGPCPGRLFINRIWTAVDPNDPNQTTSCTQTINLRDNDAPIFNGCPSDVTVTSANPNCDAIVNWSIPTASDNCGVPTVTSTHNSGSTFPEGITQVTYTATDQCGNQTVCVFYVTVVCQGCINPPVINCPSGFVACIGTDPNPGNTGFATATAGGPNCDPPVLSYTDQYLIVGPCAGRLFIQRTWRAEDPTDPTIFSTCVQTIDLKDADPPVILGCPVDITVCANTGTAYANVYWMPPTPHDNCGLSSWTTTHTPGSTFTIGNTPVTYTAIDICGTVTNCTFNVIVEPCGCTAPPMITCPADFNGCPGDDYSPASTGYATATQAGQNNIDCNAPVITYEDDIHIMGPCNGRITLFRTWTATNPDNPMMTTSCIQTINLVDDVKPVISNIPSDITLSAKHPSCAATATWTEPIATDNCGLMNFTSNISSGTDFTEGTTTVTYLAIDNCGNMVYSSFYVTVECSGCEFPPSITCPPDVALCAGSDYSPGTLGYAVAMSGSGTCSDPTLEYVDDIISTGPCSGAIEIDRIWIARDPDDWKNFASCVQNIRIEDNEAPVLSNCPTDITIQGDAACQALVTWSQPTATDNCSTVTISSSHTNGGVYSVGVTAVTIAATDDCGNVEFCNFNVTVECQPCPAPIITCPANGSSCPGGDTSPTTFGYASAVAGDPACGQPLITYTDVVSGSTACQTIERIWTASDPNDSSINSTCVQIISLVDGLAPVISNCPTDITINEDKNPVTWTAPTVNDNCGIASVTATHTSGTNFPIGTTQVCYTAIDICDNTTVCCFDVVILGNGCGVAPIVNCPANKTACPGSNYDPSSMGYATASPGGANCGTPIITHSDLIVSTGPCSTSKVIERTWTATDPDDANISSTCIQTITLNDTQDPVMTYLPDDITVHGYGASCTAVATWAEPNATDNCQLSSISSNIPSGSTFNEGNTIVQYTAVDACGNDTHYSFKVTVICNAICNTPASISCPADAVVCIGADISPAAVGSPTFSAGPNCPQPTVSYHDIIMNTGPCAGAKELKRVWTASYPGYPNLDATCEHWITIRDTEAPEFWDCPSNIVVGCSGVANWADPMLTDDCSSYTVSSNHSSGDVFPVGTTTVLYTGTDACGNVTHCSFTVTVNCNPLPFDCPDDIIVSCGSTGCTTVNWNAPSYSGSCPDCVPGQNINGFIYMGQYNGNLYYCSLAPSTWQNAQSICQSIGGSLAIINSPGENAFLANILVNQSAYIGLSDVASEGNYTWVDGTPMTWSNWYAGQPNNFNNQQHYVEMLSNGQWNDQYATKALEFICEIPCNNVVQVAGPTPGTCLDAGTYTVKYQMNDNCGGYATCDFNITVESSLSLQCPQDAVLTCPYGDSGMIVHWDVPIANSCCSQSCGTGPTIPGFIYMGSHNGHQYYCSLTPDTWDDAQATCSSYGGYLAVIGDASENAFLANFLTNQSAYIGCSDTETEGVWKWVNGEPLYYTNWMTGQPNNWNNAQHHCEIMPNGEWNDTYSYEQLEYILEIPGCINVSQIAGPPSGTYFNAGTTTTITYQATDACGNVETCSFDITVDSPTCSPGGVATNEGWIEKIGFGNLWHASGNNNGYAEFTADKYCAVIEPCTSYPIHLEPGFPFGANVVYWKVWIDFNMDGDFFDTGEYVAYGNGAVTQTGVLTMPCTLWNGQTTMRISMKVGSYPTGPCEQFLYGETEDYCILVEGGDLHGGSTVEGRNREDAVALSGKVIENEIEISAYPNPATDFFNLEISDDELLESIDIYNVTGSLIKEVDINNYNTVQTSEMESGSYLLNIRFSDGRQTTKRIIIIE